MNDVIKVENLGKKYIISHKRQVRYYTLRDSIAHTARGIWQRVRHPLSPNCEAVDLEELWALKDVNFEVQQGERVGIIGANGAGKSTLLKILSRITEPTTGRVHLKGRVSSLLEVGTGFHPELTGRENIFLNGAILGMSKQEIKKRFDEIVAFAELEKFLDTPVKRYSSGMYVRLAFAVAAHLEPEILIVDEVLAVGDAAFQKKCLGKMQNVAKGGRTVLFVSHNMAAVQRLCPRVIYVSNGSLTMDDSSSKVIESYLCDQKDPNDNEQLLSEREYDITSAAGDDYVKLRRVRFVSSDGSSKSSFRMDEEFSIEIVYDVLKSISNFHLYIRVHNQDGILAFNSADWDGREIESHQIYPGKYVKYCKIPANLLNRGLYTLDLHGLIPNIRYLFQESSVLRWEITSLGGIGGVQSVERKGLFRIMLQWSDEEINKLHEL